MYIKSVSGISIIDFRNDITVKELKLIIKDKLNWAVDH